MTIEKKTGTEITSASGSQEWVLLQRQCSAFVASQLLPQHIYEGAKSDDEVLAKALTIAWKGRELGIPPLYALSSITVIKGKPALSAELMLSLVLRKYPTANPQFLVKEGSCSVTMTRPGGAPQTFTFTLDDAKKAGLLRPGSPWEKYPRAMLRARVTSEACRSLFPEALMGAIYTHEELGAAVIDVESFESEAPLVKAPPQKNHPGPVEQKGFGVVSTKQIARLMAIANEQGWTEADVNQTIHDVWGLESKKDLNPKQYEELVSEIQNGPKEKTFEEFSGLAPVSKERT